MYNPKREIFPGEMSYIKFPKEIIKKIFIGDLISANNLTLLKRNNITTVISLLNKEDVLEKVENISYHRFTIEDGEGDIIKISEKVYEIIKNSDSILIHCFAGMSRSVSVLIYYLMVELNINYSKARKIIKNSRHIIGPCEFYKKQLITLNK